MWRSLLDFVLGVAVIVGVVGAARNVGRWARLIPHAALFFGGAILLEFYPPAGDSHRPPVWMWVMLAMTAGGAAYVAVRKMRERDR